jgi:hypothetical protein
MIHGVGKAAMLKHRASHRAFKMGNAKHPEKIG